MPNTRQFIHHIAIEVTDIARSVAWYQAQANCDVDYQDESWALLNFANVKLALVLPTEHPRHIAFTTTPEALTGKLTTHRDGTRSRYVKDPDGNYVEWLIPDYSS